MKTLLALLLPATLLLGACAHKEAPDPAAGAPAVKMGNSAGVGQHGAASAGRSFGGMSGTGGS